MIYFRPPGPPGPLEAGADGRAIDIGGPQRALLAMLLLRANEPAPAASSLTSCE